MELLSACHRRVYICICLGSFDDNRPRCIWWCTSSKHLHTVMKRIVNRTEGYKSWFQLTVHWKSTKKKTILFWPERASIMFPVNHSLSRFRTTTAYWNSSRCISSFFLSFFFVVVDWLNEQTIFFGHDKTFG